MRIEYQCTAEDFAEVQGLFAMRLAGVPSLVLLALGVVQLVLALTSPVSPTEPVSAGAALANMLMWVAVAVVFWLVLFRLLARQPEAKSAHRHVWPTRALCVVVWTAVIWAHVAKDPARGVSEALATLLLSSPWALLAWLLSAGLGRIQRRHALGRWPYVEHLHPVQTCEMSDSGIRIETAAWSWDYRWRAIREVRETPRLIVLMVSRMEFVMVPKRAFASAEQFNQFIAALRTNTHATPLPIPPPNAAAIPVATLVTARDETQV